MYKGYNMGLRFEMAEARIYPGYSFVGDIFRLVTLVYIVINEKNLTVYKSF